MARKTYDWQDIHFAEDLYVKDGLTYKEVSEKTGTPLATIQKWGRDRGWKSLRQTFLEQCRTIEENLRKIHANLTQEILDSKDPQKIFAMLRLDKRLEERDRRRPDNEGLDIDRPRLFLEDLEFIAAVLKEIDPKGLKVLSKNYDTIVKRFKEQHAQAA